MTGDGTIAVWVVPVGVTAEFSATPALNNCTKGSFLEKILLQIVASLGDTI
ncbi:MAG: hypothetical protein IBX61_00655 [Thermoleophilia bacterium]|nr:hypothetical protein [Thermoleophilia bacterium]